MRTLLSLLALCLLCRSSFGAQHLLERHLAGQRALERGLLDVAETEVRALLAELPEHGASAWALAGVLARRGQVDAAWQALERAADVQSLDLALAQADPDLELLRKRSDWKKRLAALAQRSPVASARDSASDREHSPWGVGRFSMLGDCWALCDSSWNALGLVDRASGLRIGNWSAQLSGAWAAAASQDGKWLVRVESGRASAGSPTETLHVCAMPSGRVEQHITGLPSGRTLRFGAGDQWLVFGEQGKSLRLWSLREQKFAPWVPENSLEIALARDAQRALVVGWGSTQKLKVLVVELIDGEVLGEWEFESMEGEWSAGLSADGERAWIHLAGARELLVCDVNGMRELARWSTAEPQSKVDFIGTSHELLSVGAGGLVQRW